MSPLLWFCLYLVVGAYTVHDIAVWPPKICTDKQIQKREFSTLVIESAKEEDVIWSEWADEKYRICDITVEEQNLFRAIPTLLHRSHRFSRSQLLGGEAQASRVMRNLASCSKMNPASVTAYYNDRQLEAVMEKAIDKANPNPNPNPNPNCGHHSSAHGSSSLLHADGN